MCVTAVQKRAPNLIMEVRPTTSCSDKATYSIHVMPGRYAHGIFSSSNFKLLLPSLNPLLKPNSMYWKPDKEKNPKNITSN